MFVLPELIFSIAIHNASWYNLARVLFNIYMPLHKQCLSWHYKRKCITLYYSVYYLKARIIYLCGVTISLLYGIYTSANLCCLYSYISVFHFLWIMLIFPNKFKCLKDRELINSREPMNLSLQYFYNIFTISLL